MAVAVIILLGSSAYVAAQIPSFPLSAATPQVTTAPMAASSLCQATLKQLTNMVILNSGSITVAGAFLSTGAEAARWQEAQAARSGFGLDSPWRNNPDGMVYLCYYDGDFTVMTPGPPGHDTGASRVVITVSNGFAELTNLGKAEKIPVVDPGGL